MIGGAHFRHLMKHHTPVFYVSVVLTALLVFWGYFAHEHLADTAQSTLTLTISNFGWFYLLSTAGFVGFCSISSSALMPILNSANRMIRLNIPFHPGLRCSSPPAWVSASFSSAWLNR